MTEQEMITRIGNLEAELDRLRRTVAILPSGSSAASKESTSINLGSLPLSLKKILNWGFEWVGSKVNVKAKANSGITVDANGVGVKVRANYGLNLDSNGLALKKQSAVSGAAATTLVVVNAGGDSIDRADLNAKLTTLKTEIDAINTAVSAIISRLQAAEVTL